ncbi:hypothetical protein RM545_08925 [Zunongwangia sp. F260]|uniref:Uncharacterized protein n=1 Tax=Autumnicola lenta TaxID=3075593 RepID=A0ABU3CKQ5_9FLAO|nr:hypothetical protein [Zunongwangia sp. F260]MDT0646812.1 hypothetical protein [Zunongwangia sp. F260]
MEIFDLEFESRVNCNRKSEEFNFRILFSLLKIKAPKSQLSANKFSAEKVESGKWRVNFRFSRSFKKVEGQIWQFSTNKFSAKKVESGKWRVHFLLSSLL